MVFVAVILVHYLYAILHYHALFKHRFLTLRNAVLACANISGAGPKGDCRYEISGIAEESGSVVLTVEQESSKFLFAGTTLVVVSTQTQQEWGTVRVAEFSHGLAHAEVVDRTHPDFWEELEDRMKTDPSPPKGFHLEPYGLRRLDELMKGTQQ